jgi:hypothetical protein
MSEDMVKVVVVVVAHGAMSRLTEMSSCHGLIHRP